MELQTNIERRDLEAFFEHYRTTTSSSRFWTIIWAWLLLLIGVLAALRFARSGMASSFLVWSSLFVAWALLGKRWLRWLTRWLTGRFMTASLAKQDLSAHLGTQRLRVTPDGLFCESSTGSSTTTWSSLKRIEDGPEHTFIYLSDIAALIVPHRAAPPEQLRAFLSELRERAAA